MRKWIVGACRQDGFSLVETIVAFAILSLVVALTTEIIGGAALRERKTQTRMSALAHAESLVSALSSRPALPVASSAGAFEDSYSWKLTVSRVPEAQTSEHDLAPYVAEIEVSTPSQDASVALKTILLGASGAVAQP